LSPTQDAAGLAASPDAAATGALILAGGLLLVPLAVGLTRALTPAPAPVGVRWNLLHVVAVLALALVAASALASGLLAAGIELPELLLGQAATAFGLGVATLAAVLLARSLAPERLASLGLRRGGNLRAVAAGLASYLLCAPALVGAMLAWPWLFERLGGTWTQQPIVTQIGQLDPAGVAALALLAVAVQPLLEEVLFRSFVQPVLVQAAGARGGVALTSVLFAGLHGGSAFLPIFGLSLLLGALMLRTQRLAPVAVVHALHNGAMLLLVFLVPEVAGSPAEPSAPGLVPLSLLLP
jgi:membrane protease YdiL (CAAX protease family)